MVDTVALSLLCQMYEIYICSTSPSCWGDRKSCDRWTAPEVSLDTIGDLDFGEDCSFSEGPGEGGCRK